MRVILIKSNMDNNSMVRNLFFLRVEPGSGTSRVASASLVGGLQLCIEYSNALTRSNLLSYIIEHA